MALLKLSWLLFACEVWLPGSLLTLTPFDKSTIGQVRMKFRKQSLNVPWCTEHITACGAEPVRYP